MRLWQTNPFRDIVLVRGEGSRVWDSTGKSYLDMHSGAWSNVLGAGHPRWLAAIREQSEKIAHVGAPYLTSEISGAMDKLSEILPPELDRAVFLNTGSEAVDLALQMAAAATGADGIAAIEHGFYGSTSYPLSLSEAGRAARHLAPPRMLRLPAPDCARCPAGQAWPCGTFPCLGALKDAARTGEPRLAAVIYEPVFGRTILVPPLGYGARLRELTRELGLLLIANEVTSGMGRTGRWFGFMHDGIVPDLLVMGKAIGAGLPVSAVVTTAEVETRCGGAVSHTQSHQNDPFSGRIASEVISIMQDERLVERSAERGAYLLARLRDLQTRCPVIREARGRGLMVGIELRPEAASRGPDVVKRMQQAGYLLDYQAVAATFRLFPPYGITEPEIDGFVEALGDSIAASVSEATPRT